MHGAISTGRERREGPQRALSRGAPAATERTSRFRGRGDPRDRGRRGPTTPLGVAAQRAKRGLDGAVFVGGRLIELPGRRSARQIVVAPGRRGRRGNEGRRTGRQVEAREDLAGDVGVLDGGDEPHARSAARAAKRVHLEDALKELGPGQPSRTRAAGRGLGRGITAMRRSRIASRRAVVHLGIARAGAGRLRSRGRRHPLGAGLPRRGSVHVRSPRRPRPGHDAITRARARCEDAVVTDLVARGGGIRGTSRSRSSWGSIRMCVVPSRQRVFSRRARRPSGRSSRRSFASAGRAT